MIGDKFSIQKYSSMAGVFILLNQEASAEAIYTDLDPDASIQFDGQTLGIDMDNNGTFDFAFLKESWSYFFWNSASDTMRLRRQIWAGPEFISNEIAGDYFYPSAGGSILYHPYALSYNDIIDSGLSFQYWGYQIMAGAHKKLDVPDDWNFNGGHWIYDEEEHYLGVRFYDESECLHYGWIRCIVKDTVNILKILDYAYESKCGTSINAGDIIGDTLTSIDEENNLLNSNVYSFNNSIFVKLDKLITNAEIYIYDLSGKMIYLNKINNQFTQIKLNAPQGVYFVKLISGENNYSKKFYLN